ncbi:MAG: hypothetical protein A2868_00485 [Candidatus Levybacteria bacterium RIFCSPHIGHO2_01_FULL_40_15b]|nr:MAG: hypothetical protein A2868_00485 [Candidatus Levybacteria bacterium RIFCSPHIGHO2_01_FULL_40_15b]
MAKTVKDEQKPTQRYSIDKKPDGTITIKFVVPTADIEKIREQIVNELVKQVEIQGFRKGAAPRNLAEQKLNRETVREEVLKKVLTDEYVAAVKESNINPIVNPKIHVEQFAEGTDLAFEAETCETPEIDLKNYKDEVRKIKPAPKIVIPGQAASAQGSGEPKEEANKKLDEILAAILRVTQIQIPKILIDQETNRLLSQLLDEIKRLGVSLDQYLSSRGKSEADLRKEYEERAEKDLKLEFLLRKIADEEKIIVEQKEIDEAIGAIKDEKQRKDIAQNPYLVASIIRQQKTLSYLTKI